jgi:alpha-L-rhamnosidase
VGVDLPNPRLSWRVESSARGQVQTAYRILVASTPEKLKENQGDLWDSGRIAADITHDLAYSGVRLTSHLRCHWKVMVWDRDGVASGWSDPATWTQGMMHPSDWTADWIGYDAARSVTASNGWVLPPVPLFRSEFTADRPVARALLYATALGNVDVRLNGQRVDEGFFTPGWTDYTRRVLYRAWDVTAIVRRGANCLGAELSDGWYSGYLGFGKRRDHYGKLPRFRVQLVLIYADGTRSVTGTDARWRAWADGPRREADFLSGETYDAGREVSGWDVPGFHARGWEAVVTGSSEVHPVIGWHPGPPVVAFAELRPIAITEPSPRTYVMNLGQNFAGVYRLKVRGRPGQQIRLRFGERLNPDGSLYTTNLREARVVDTYVCRGEGTEVWSPRFTYHGYQYVELTGLSEPPGKGVFTGIALGSDTPVAGAFSCSDAMVNRLVSNIRWTQRMNFIDIPTDCPQRDERLGWTGDAQIYIRAATLNADVQSFFAKWLTDLEDGQREDGQFPMVAPVKVSGDDGGPAWADAGVICPWTIYEVYGDRGELAKRYESMKRFIAFCEKRSAAGLLPPAQFHCFGDWLSVSADTPKDVILQAYFARSARLVARAAAALGRGDEARQYEALFQRIKAAFQRAYLTADGRIKGETQTVYAMAIVAIVAELLDGAQVAEAGRRLVADIERRGGHLSTGFIGTRDLMLALALVGRNDVACRLLQQTSFPSWGFSILNGGTTIWEHWDGWTPGKGFTDPSMNSFAHYGFGAVYHWMVENLGGIRAVTPGYGEVLIAPEPGGTFTASEARYRSIHGDITTAWRVEKGRFVMSVVIPANVRATVRVPSQSPDAVLEGGMPLGKSEGVRFLKREAGHVSVSVGSGSYRFQSLIRAEGAR